VIFSMNEVKKYKIDWKALFTGGIFFAGLVWAAHNEISKIDERLSALDKHISRVETAVRIVGAKQGGDTKALIDEALTVAKKASEAGHVESARAIADYANRLLEEETMSKANAPDEFFQRTSASYRSLWQSPELRSNAQTGVLQLAEYRSSITPQPPLPEQIATGSPQPQSGQSTVVLSRQIYHLPGAIYTHPNVNIVGDGTSTIMMKPGYSGDVLIPPSDRVEQNDESITGVNIIGGNQALDGFNWVNVTFIGVNIRFVSGTAGLHNVRFVNCTFNLPPTDKGFQVAEYAALGGNGSLLLG
jgi:hypothetical protein